MSQRFLNWTNGLFFLKYGDLVCWFVWLPWGPVILIHVLPNNQNIVNERMNSKLVQNMYLKWVKSKPSKWKVVGSLVLIKEKVTTLSTGEDFLHIILTLEVLLWGKFQPCSCNTQPEFFNNNNKWYLSSLMTVIFSFHIYLI